jgi:hypothetical protein
MPVIRHSRRTNAVCLKNGEYLVAVSRVPEDLGSEGVSRGVAGSFMPSIGGLFETPGWTARRLGSKVQYDSVGDYEIREYVESGRSIDGGAR